MSRTAIALFSGGLDSTLAIKLMQAQGIHVHAIHFTSPFFGVSPDADSGKYDARRAAEMLAVPLTIHNLGEEYLEMLRTPCHGYGKAINPCIDCHVYFLKKAGELMRSSGADFVITGEVLGQRPKSQRKDALRVVEKTAVLKGCCSVLFLQGFSNRPFRRLQGGLTEAYSLPSRDVPAKSRSGLPGSLALRSIPLLPADVSSPKFHTPPK